MSSHLPWTFFLQCQVQILYLTFAKFIANGKNTSFKFVSWCLMFAIGLAQLLCPGEFNINHFWEKSQYTNIWNPPPREGQFHFCGEGVGSFFRIWIFLKPRYLHDFFFQSLLEFFLTVCLCSMLFFLKFLHQEFCFRLLFNPPSPLKKKMKTSDNINHNKGNIVENVLQLYCW